MHTSLKVNKRKLVILIRKKLILIAETFGLGKVSIQLINNQWLRSNSKKKFKRREGIKHLNSYHKNLMSRNLWVKFYEKPHFDF